MKLELTSWLLLNGVAIKELDRTSFRWNSTRLPSDLEAFFQYSDLLNGEQRDIILDISGECYSVRIVRDRYSNRVTLTWKKDFASRLANHFPEHFTAYWNNQEPPEFGARMTLIPQGDVRDHFIVKFDCRSQDL